MHQNIQIIRDKYTGRDHFLKNRKTYLLRLHAIVPDNSYLISAAMPLILHSKEEVLRAEINRVVNMNKVNDINQYLRNIVNILLSKDKRNINEFPIINGRYFIPASSIKGAVRSRIEYKFMPKTGKSLSCYIVEENFNSRYAINHIRFWGDRVTIPRGRCNPMKYDNVCIVCDMFGSLSLASLVNFSDAYMVEGDTEVLDELNGIKAVTPNSRFELEISCYNFSDTMLGLLFLGLELFSKSPIILGMFKYRYNPKLVNKLFRGKYTIGLLQFELREIIDSSGKSYNINERLKSTELELKEKLDEYIEWNIGVIGNK